MIVPAPRKTPSPTSVPLRRTALRVAGAFFVFWALVLFAGADHPPPPGFAALLLLVALAAWGLYRRFPVYVHWACARVTGRWWRVSAEGVAAGVAVAACLLALPHPSQPGLPRPGLADVALWFGVLAVAGALQALAIYALATGLARWTAACLPQPSPYSEFGRK